MYAVSNLNSYCTFHTMPQSDLKRSIICGTKCIIFSLMSLNGVLKLKYDQHLNTMTLYSEKNIWKILGSKNAVDRKIIRLLEIIRVKKLIVNVVL